MRLLYVEDDLDLAALVALTLRQAGHEVALTDRVSQVVELAREVDAVITDGVLLDGTADDVLAVLADDPATAGLPVVLCSVRPDAVQHPMIVGRLRKPLSVADLAGDLEVALGGLGPDVPPPTADGVDGSVRQRGLHELERRALAIGDLGAAVLCTEDVTERRRAVEREAHQAVGLAGALGEADLAEAAGEAERLLRTDGPLDLTAAARLCELGALLEDGARERLEVVAEVAPARGGGPVRGRVALVDDDEALVALIRARLEAADVEVEAHHHGREALEALTADDAVPVDVVVLDVDLPGMNGLSVLSGLQQAGILRRSRVVLATVHGNEAELALALATRRVRHLPKPFELDQLVGAVLEEVVR